MFGLKEEIRARRRRNNFTQWERPPLENGQVTGGDKVAVFLVFVFAFFFKLRKPILWFLESEFWPPGR